MTSMLSKGCTLQAQGYRKVINDPHPGRLHTTVGNTHVHRCGWGSRQAPSPVRGRPDLTGPPRAQTPTTNPTQFIAVRLPHSSTQDKPPSPPGSPHPAAWSHSPLARPAVPGVTSSQ